MRGLVAEVLLLARLGHAGCTMVPGGRARDSATAVAGKSWHRAAGADRTRNGLPHTLVCETLLVLEKDPSAPLLAELRPVQIDE